MKPRAIFVFSILISLSCTEPKNTTTDKAQISADHTFPADNTVSPDNTKVNVRDTSRSTLTPGDQLENTKDLGITQQIRQEVMKDELSFNAKNIKIITVDGVVTLRGPVQSRAEKLKIGSLVKQVRGVKQLDNQLEVAAK